MSSVFDRLLKRERVVAGIMSGTSLDGIDTVIVKLSGSGRNLDVGILGHAFLPYSNELKTTLLRNSGSETSSVVEISQLNALLPRFYAESVRAALDQANFPVSELDLVGSHGQTIQHIPNPSPCAGFGVTSTLQIGDISALAVLLGVPVVGDFRSADLALGGQGAPLVPYLDYVLFTDAMELRGLLNIGGISNLTVLPPDAALDRVRAFDTGPGNMIMDGLARRLLNKPYDEDGKEAQRGTVDPGILQRLLTDEYLTVSPPKSTGRERYGAEFLQKLLDDFPDRSASDWLSTAAEYTVQSIYSAWSMFLSDEGPLDRLIVSGGGSQNPVLMEGLKRSFTGTTVESSTSHHLPSEMKEAVCFAVLAHEFLNGIPTNLPSVTGASRPTLLGKLALPG